MVLDVKIVGNPVEIKYFIKVTKDQGTKFVKLYIILAGPSLGLDLVVEMANNPYREYGRGQILEIKLKNFMTYKKIATITPSPGYFHTLKF